MKKISFFLALAASAIVIGSVNHGLTVSAKAVTADECLPAVTELSKTYSRLNGYSGADWEDVLPDIYGKTVTVDGNSAYEFDYGKALSHLKKYFTDKTASDLLHRKNTGLFLSGGKMYFMSGFSAAPCPMLAFYDGSGYSGSPVAASLSDITESNGTITATVKYAIIKDYDEKNKQTEYSETLTFVADGDAVKISGGTMIDKLLGDHPVYVYDVENPLTFDMLPVVSLLALAAALILAYTSKRRAF